MKFSIANFMAAALAASRSPNLDSRSRSFDEPTGQRRGQITYGARSVLRYPGTPRGYAPDASKVGMRVRFRTGLYVVGSAGNLLRVRQ